MDLGLWLNKIVKKLNIKVPNDFPNFIVWKKDATMGLHEGLVWETIESIEKKRNEVVFDITVPKYHNFFANGFLVSNCGREDIDARCLDWRPFVLEILGPRNILIDIRRCARKIPSKVKVRKMRLSSIAEVRQIKEAKIDKTYRVLVTTDKPVTAKDLKKATALVTTIEQHTPSRVLHRRADLLRRRAVRKLRIKRLSPRKLELVVTSESGTYIKELVHGDDGRTTPSLASLLGCACTVRELDVIKIHRAR